MIRDVNAGRFSSDSSLVLLTHGLSLRIFLMRWFHWTVDEFLNVFNPPNAAPLVRCQLLPALHIRLPRQNVGNSAPASRSYALPCDGPHASVAVPARQHERDMYDGPLQAIAMRGQGWKANKAP